MGSRLLNGSPQLSVRVMISPLILVVLASIVIPGTTAGIPVINSGSIMAHIYICIY